MTMTVETSFTQQLGNALFINERSLPMAAVKIYQGGMVALFAGYAQEAAPVTAGSPEVVVVGKCAGIGSKGTGPITSNETNPDNTAGAPGDKFVRVICGIFLLKNSAGVEAITQADANKRCYMVDGQTVSRNSNLGKRPVMGVVIGVTTASEAGAAGVYVQVGVLETQRIVVQVLANADLTLFQYGIVKITAGKAAKATGATDGLWGILQNAPNINEVAEVCLYGPSLLKAGAGFTVALDITSDGAGLGINATAGLFAGPTVGADLAVIATADAAVQGGAYVQADVQTIATLANAIKAYINGVGVTFWNALKADRAAMSLGSRTIAKAYETAAGGETKMVFVQPGGRI